MLEDLQKKTPLVTYTMYSLQGPEHEKKRENLNKPVVGTGKN